MGSSRVQVGLGRLGSEKCFGGFGEKSNIKAFVYRVYGETWAPVCEFFRQKVLAHAKALVPTLLGCYVFLPIPHSPKRVGSTGRCSAKSCVSHPSRGCRRHSAWRGLSGCPSEQN